MTSRDLRRLGRSLRHVILPLVVFLVWLQIFEILLMGVIYGGD